MKLSSRGAAGLAATVATAVVVSLIPGADAAPRSAAPATHQSASSVSPHQASANKQGNLTSQVRGTFGRNGTVRGRFDPKRFVVRSGATYAVGTLNAKLEKGDGTVIGRKTKTVTLPIENGSVSDGSAKRCQVLDLVLGPLDLDLLGLQVHLNKVVLHIVAVSGAGNLLDGTGLLDLLKLVNKLNQILNALRP